MARVFPVRHARSAPSPAPPRRGGRERLVATASRCERACKRTGEPSGAFCGKGGARERGDGGFFAADASAKSKKDVGAKRTLLRRVARFSGAACTPRPIPRAARRGSRKRPESAAQASRARLQARSRSKRGLLRKRRSKGARRRRLFCGRCNLPKAKKTSEQSGLCSDVARLAGFEPATYRFVAGHSIH